jgi:hypothetical protein
MTSSGHLSCGVTGKMVFEQMLTILLGTGVGVAVVLYTVKPRQIMASQSFVSGGSSVETFSLSSSSTSDSQNDAAPMPEVTATQSPVVEAPVEESNVASSGATSTMTAEVAAASSSDAPIASIDASAVSSPASLSVPVESQTTPVVRAHRVRKSSASSRAPAKSRDSSHTARTTRKR